MTSFSFSFGYSPQQQFGYNSGSFAFAQSGDGFSMAFAASNGGFASAMSGMGGPLAAAGMEDPLAGIIPQMEILNAGVQSSQYNCGFPNFQLNNYCNNNYGYQNQFMSNSQRDPILLMLEQIMLMLMEMLARITNGCQQNSSNYNSNTLPPLNIPNYNFKPGGGNFGGGGASGTWDSAPSRIDNSATLPSGVGARALALAERQLGANESDGSYRKFGQPGPWCAAFVDWAYKSATGGQVPWKGENFHYCPNVERWAKKNGVWENYNPNTVGQNVKAGDMVLFDWGQDGKADHIGMVTKINSDGSIETIEGNSGNAVRHRKYRAGDPRIKGFMKAHELEERGKLRAG